MLMKTPFKRLSADPKEHAAQGFLSWLPFLLLGIGIAIRLLYLLESRTNPLFQYPVLDADNYHKYALWIINGRGWPEGVFTANPFYPYLLSSIYRFLTRNPLCIRIIQIFVGLAACMLIAMTSANIFGRKAGIAALGLALFYGPLISFEGELLAEVWTIAFISAAFYFLSLSGPGAKHQNRRLLLSGLGIGLAVLGRPNILLFVPFAMGWVAWTFRDKGWEVPLKRGLILGLGICLAIAPVTMRNYFQGGEFVLVTAHGGVNFFIGNNDQATGWFITPPGSGLRGGQESLIESATDVARMELGGRVTASEVSHYWFHRGLDFIVKNPGNYLALLGKKLYYAWHGYEKSLASNYYFNQRYSLALRYMTIGFWLLGPLALLGMIGAFPMRRAIGWLYIFIAIYLISLLLFFVNTRYRLPMIPALIVFASFGIMSLLKTISERRWKRAGMYILVILFFIALFNYPIFEKEKDIAHMYYLVGTQASIANDYDHAIDFLKQAVSIDEQPTFLNNLGVAYKKKGLHEMAIQYYEKAILSNPDYLRPYLNLGDLYQILGRYEEAERIYHMALRKDPGYAIIHYQLGRLYTSTGAYEKAIASYRRMIESDPLLLDGYYMLAELYKKKGDHHEETEVLEKLLTISNGNVKPSVYKRLWTYYAAVSPNHEKALFYKLRYESVRFNSDDRSCESF